MLSVGDDVVVLEATAERRARYAHRRTSIPRDDRPSVTLDGAAGRGDPRSRARLRDVARLLFAADSVGVAQACTEMASAYANTRTQFGRLIGTFQAVKHHCANMAVAAELATAAVWDAARAADVGEPGDEVFTYAAAIAAALALPAADLNAQLNTQVHGGIGFTWEHDAHLFLRRATAIEALIDARSGRCRHRRRSIGEAPG